jgi:hypothetical protein
MLRRKNEMGSGRKTKIMNLFIIKNLNKQEIGVPGIKFSSMCRAVGFFHKLDFSTPGTSA